MWPFGGNRTIKGSDTVTQQQASPRAATATVNPMVEARSDVLSVRTGYQYKVVTSIDGKLKFVPIGLPRSLRQLWQVGVNDLVSASILLPATLNILKMIPLGDGQRDEMVDTSFVAKTASNQNVWFRWSLPFLGKMDGAVWQIVSFPFPSDLAHWRDPPGLVASGPIDSLPTKPDEPTDFIIDFRKVAVALLALHTQPDSVKAGGFIQGIIRFIPGAYSIRDWIVARRKNVPRPYRPDPMTYYVRVVALADVKGQQRVVALSNPVVVQRGTPPPASTTDSSILEHPTVRIVAYTPIQEEKADAQFHFIATQDSSGPFPFPAGAFWKAGAHVDLTPQPDNRSWYDKVADDIADAVSAIGDFFESAVNWVANEYNTIKSDAVDAVASTLGCSGACKQFLEAAVDTGLAAIGLPPTLPNFDQLVNDGTDYLVQYTAEQAGIPTGVTQDVAVAAAKAGIDKLKQEAAAAASGAGQGGFYAGLKPDPDYQYRPAKLMLEVTGGIRTLPVIVHIRVAYDSGTVPVFGQVGIPIPQMRLGQTLQVPVLLKEYTMPASDWWTKRWNEEYYNGTTSFSTATCIRDARTGDIDVDHEHDQDSVTLQPSQRWGTQS